MEGSNNQRNSKKEKFLRGGKTWILELKWLKWLATSGQKFVIQWLNSVSHCNEID